MVHAKNAVLQEMVASTLSGHEIPMVSRKIYKAAKEMADMENSLRPPVLVVKNHRYAPAGHLLRGVWPSTMYNDHAL
jgi:hypothetical protein